MGSVLMAEDVSIRYITGDFKDIGIKEYTMRRLTNNYHVKEFMAVDGVSFELEEGDLLGIIGSNGAGKSTLLKAIAGIMEPTRGHIQTTGEVAALLELGSGFDGDLTVKENAYLRGAMLGYTKEFMDQTYDQIIDFAELRDFEDRPFKQLSSGMKSRLAFSIASLVQPDILILDEILSVGDGAFQEKSAQKMREIISNGAVTILVSHSLDQIRELCNKVLWLDHGRQIAFGETEEICNQYERFLEGKLNISSFGKKQSTSDEATVIVNEIEHSRTKWSKRIIFAQVVFSLFLATVLCAVGNGIIKGTLKSSRIEIYAESGYVTFRGAQVDGTWYSPNDMLVDRGNWIEDTEQATYKAVDGQPLIFNLPSGAERTITFNAGPEEGTAAVKINDIIQHLSFFNENEVPLGVPYPVQSAVASTIPLYFIPLGATVIFVLSCFYKASSTGDTGRDISGDVLRVICCFTVVLLHCTCNRLGDFGESLSDWYPHLLMNSFTVFAVPCFYMLSGAYLLTRPQCIRTVLYRRVPRILIPLLFWSIIYILVSGEITFRKFAEMFFQEQTPHLWYLYCLLGLYMLLPALSKMYQMLNGKEKVYLLILLLFIPGILHDIESLADRYVKMPYFAMFWPDLGLFFLGAFLSEQTERLYRFRRMMPLVFLSGWGITVLVTKYVCLRDWSANKNFFSIGSIGVLMMASSLFLICRFVIDRLNKIPEHIKHIIHVLGERSFGVYLIHPLVMQLWNHQNIAIFPLFSNEGSMLDMITGAVLYFIISAVICWSGRQIKGAYYVM